LPVTIPAGEGRSVTVAAKMPGQAGTFTRTMSLMVDDGDLQKIRFRVMGRIRKEAAGLSVTE
jgi:hypothetical protein